MISEQFSLVCICLLYPYISCSSPIVTVISAGYHEILNSDPFVSKAAGSVTLVQSNGKNILVDTGTTNIVASIKDSLWNLQRLTPDNISLTFITHTHPDHYSNVMLFSTTQSWWTYNVTGDIFSAYPLQYDKSYYIFDDDNLEVWATPGHTPQDCSLLVHNWNNSGTTLGVVGDLFFNASDIEDPNLWESASNDVSAQKVNRRMVACAVDYIIPGHGSMFAVTNEMKDDAFACNNSSFNFSCYHLQLLFLFCAAFFRNYLLC